MFSQESVCPSFCSGGSPCDHYPWCIRPHCISPPSRHGDTPSTTLPLPNIVWPSLGTCSNRFIGPHCTALGYGNPLGRVRVIQIGFFKWYLPHTYEVGEGNVFRGVCLSTEGGFSVFGSMFLLRGLCLLFHVPSGRGVSLTETLLDRDPSPWTEDPPMVKSGRYASYWNAFLLTIKSCWLDLNLTKTFWNTGE